MAICAVNMLGTFLNGEIVRVSDYQCVPTLWIRWHGDGLHQKLVN